MDRNVAKLTNVESRRIADEAHADEDRTGERPTGEGPTGEGPTGEDRPNDVGGVPLPAPDEPTRPAPPGSVALDRAAIADDAVGDDTIREGRAGGIEGPHHASRGQGQGG